MVDSSEGRDALIDKAVELIAELQTATDTARDIAKMRISAWEKLTVLNAGSIALSFTAASGFRGHMRFDGAIGYLFAAWKALAVSIMLAVFAQLVAVRSAGRLQARVTALIQKTRIDVLRGSARVSGIDLPHQKDAYDALKKIATTEDHYSERVSLWSGVIAFSLTCVAYYWLYRFTVFNFRS